MLDAIIHFSIKNKLIVGIFTLALVIWGTYSFTKLPIDAVPDITNNQVQVITTSPSLAAQEVERLITFPIETTMSTIPQLEEMRSISRFGLSVVTLVFTEDTDVYWARQQVFERLQMAVSQIPQGVGVPELAPVSTGLGEIYQYTISAKKGFEKEFDAMKLRDIQDWIVRRQLLGTEGVADVSSFGGFLKQYEISLNPDLLRSMNVSISDVFMALEQNNQNTGGAYIDKKPNAYFIRSEGLITNLDDIKKIVVKKNANGIPLLINDIGKVQLGSAIRYGALTQDGQGEAVGGIVLMLKGANSSQVVENVKERMETIKKSLPEGVEINVYLDRTRLVDKAIQTVSQNLLEGALIVIFVLVLMLGNLRAGLVVASVIPLAMLFAISLMNVFGVSGNLMSLGAIDFGLIVDGAVIIVEATLHHLFSKKQTQPLSQEEMDEEVYHAASKIRSAAAFGEIIILIVYLPILSLSGVEGKMFKPMAQTVAFAILGAFILSLTYVPMMSALFLSKNLVRHQSNIFENISNKIIHFFQKLYTPTIRFALKIKWLVVIGSVVAFLGSIVLFLQMGGEFIPSLEEGDFALETRVLTGSSMSHTIQTTLKTEQVLRQNFPEVVRTIGKIGTAEIPTDPMPIEACDLMVILKDKEEWTSASTREELAEKMAEVLHEEVPEATFGFLQPIQMRFNELMTGFRQDVALKIFGEDLNVLSEQANKVAAIIKDVEGLKDLYVEKLDGLPQIVIEYDRSQLAKFGMSVESANQFVSTAFAGASAGWVYENERRYDLVLRLSEEKRQSLEDIRNLYVMNNQGMQIPLHQIAKIDFKVGVNQIQREDAKRRITVAFNVRGRDVESLVHEIQDLIDQKLKLPSGYFITYGGQFKNLEEAKSRLAVAVPLALFIIFLLLFFTFNSIKQSLLIFTAIPLSAMGGIWALWLRDMPFSISAGVGFIALFGVAVLNGIVLVGEFNFLKNSGITDIEERVMKGTSIRLRPVLMTALVASLGFLPMAISQGAGAEVQKPLATVVIGGLITATLLTLLVLPCLYVLFEGEFKKTVNSKIMIILIGFSLLIFDNQEIKAQSPSKKVNMNEAIQWALKQNHAVKAGLYEIDKQQVLKKSTSDIGKTNVFWMGGKYNSVNFDNNFTITQTLPFPSVFGKRADLLESQLKSSQIQLQVTQNQLVFEVKSAYLQGVYYQAIHQLLSQQDSLFASFVKAAKLRHQTGEGTLLEKSMAENQSLEIKMLINQNQSNIEISQRQLQLLLNTDENIVVAENNLQKLDLSLNLKDSSQLAQNPKLLWLNQQITQTQKETSLMKSSLLPDIMIGYFNQSLIGYQTINNQDKYFDASDRFQGFQLGLSFPLWLKPHKARIEASQKAEKVVEEQSQLFDKQIKAQFATTLEEYSKAKATLQYYEESLLPNQQLMMTQATKAYQVGEIGYVEYAQVLSKNLQYQQQYLLAVLQHNQVVIQLEYLLGKTE
ncbi:MAG: CusA/CzcA family heavy metal efflux RND transporter [Flammeovirgaceae bacterium]